MDASVLPELVGRARLFAVAAHEAVGQVRKYDREPYWRHCEAVAALVWDATGSPEATAAAWLHDVLEDTQVKADTIAGAFGDEVEALVVELTDVSRPEDGNRKARKAIDRAHNARASALGQTIKVADLINNSVSITAHDPGFARVFMGEMRALLDVLTLAEPGLLERGREVVRRFERGRGG